VVTNAAGITWSTEFTAEADGKYSYNAPLTATKRTTAATVAGATPARPSPSTERVQERPTERAPERPTRRPGNAAASRSTKDTVAEAEPPPAPKQDAEPPPPPKPDAGVPAVAQELPKINPVAPAAPRAPALVPVNTVTKLSGDLPQLKANVTEPSADVTAKMCIGIDGHVTSAKIMKSLPEIADELQRALVTWRYKPYVNTTGQPSSACFALTFRVVFKHTN
jgi:hypothetical protein